MTGVAKGSIARIKRDLVKSADGLMDAEALRGATTLAQALGVYLTALQELLAQRNCHRITVDEAGDLSVVSADQPLVPLDGVIADLKRLGAAFPDPPACRVCGCTDNRSCFFVCSWVEEDAPHLAGPICSLCKDEYAADVEGSEDCAAEPPASDKEGL